MYQNKRYNILIDLKNSDEAGFEWLPDEEGIETLYLVSFCSSLTFEWLPDEEGIETLKCLLSFAN